MIRRGLPVSLVMLIVAFAAVRVHAQTAGDGPRAGTAFMYGGLLVTSIVHDKQDPSAGYLHYNFIGELDWPATGTVVGGGAFIARHWSVGCELAFRREMSTTIAEKEYFHVDTSTLSALYTSRERLLSFPVRAHVHPLARVDVAPLGGLTISTAAQSLTDQRGFFYPVGRPPNPISLPDVALDATKVGLFGGADVTVRLGHGLRLIVAPRLHWIHRDETDSYTHVVPYAGRVITAIHFGLEWRPGS